MFLFHVPLRTFSFEFWIESKNGFERVMGSAKDEAGAFVEIHMLICGRISDLTSTINDVPKKNKKGKRVA